MGFCYMIELVKKMTEYFKFGGAMPNQLKVSLENIIPLTEARDHFSQIVTEVQKDKLYVLTKGGKPAVAIIDVKYLETISGGMVRTDHVEAEIQKDPSKVGRTTMTKHDLPTSPAKPSDSSNLVFPKTDETSKPSVTTANGPIDMTNQPIKINFQPAEQSSLGNTAAPIPTTPTIPTPPITPTPPATPPPAAVPIPATPVSPANQAPIQPNAPMNNSSGMIDVIQSPEEQTTSNNPRVSQDDKPGPAQYTGADTDELDDMEI